MSDVKSCKKCQKELPVREFHFNRDSSNTGRTRSYCKSCCSAYQREYYRKNKAKILSQTKQYQQKNPEKRREYKLLAKYNLTEEQYRQMLYKQNGVCAICNKTQNKKLFVDHDHQTNKVRGLLCDACNKALGLFQDNINSLNTAIEYLKNAK